MKIIKPPHPLFPGGPVHVVVVFFFLLKRIFTCSCIETHVTSIDHIFSFYFIHYELACIHLFEFYQKINMSFSNSLYKVHRMIFVFKKYAKL